MTTTPKLLIITDLDGTLLDRDSYSFDPARPALDLIRLKGIPLILSSSKTRVEIEHYRKKLENDHPFVSENGGAVFVPRDYFSFPFPYDREREQYFVLELGTFYPWIIEVLESIKKETGIGIKGFSDLSEEELAFLCGMSLEEAGFAKKREYDEAFMIEGGEREIETVRGKIEGKGMNYVWGGKFHHILGKNDKGKAVEILKELYSRAFSSILTIAIGDALNDLPMLERADYAFFLKGKGDGSLNLLPPLKHVTTVDASGPQAWNEAMLSILRKVIN